MKKKVNSIFKVSWKKSIEISHFKPYVVVSLKETSTEVSNPK